MQSKLPPAGRRYLKGSRYLLLRNRKNLTKGRHLWLRNNASTVVSQFVDTTLVVVVLFVGTDMEARIPDLVFHGWLFKTLCALLDTPFFYLAVWHFERHLPVDQGPHTTFG